jgi:2-polyprenyl-6-hydroxyphenyl methylase/3-demethylubiquinone-9 3-methyltransferase
MTEAPQPASGLQAKSIDLQEIAHFSAMAETWWDPKGPFRPLHLLNPARLDYLVEKICAHHGRQPHDRQPLKGLKLLDIGCGGGLLCEPMARLGAEVTGIDASEKNIRIASLHAEKSGLHINYLATSAEALAEQKARFDIVLTMEVIEHVADTGSFLKAASHLLNGKGIMILSTLNRTSKAYLLAIVGAEYVLRWLPKGTHDWKKFITPTEFTALLKDAGLTVDDIMGLSYNPISARWSTNARDLAVNYMMTATHSAG